MKIVKYETTLLFDKVYYLLFYYPDSKKAELFRLPGFTNAPDRLAGYEAETWDEAMRKAEQNAKK